MKVLLPFLVSLLATSVAQNCNYGSYGQCTSGVEVAMPLNGNTRNCPPKTRPCVYPACEYVYDTPGPCVNGQQTRTFTKKVTPCTEVVPPETTIACSSSQPCEYVYGPWSTCDKGVQTRTSSKKDSGCVVRSLPIESRTCKVCEYDTSAWKCDNGIETRTVTKTNAPCEAPATEPATQRKGACTSRACVYDFGPFSVCKDGKQSRTFKTLNEPCDTMSTPVTTVACTEPTCEYSYGSWGTCSGGAQVRTYKVLNEPCKHSGIPKTQRSCAMCTYDFSDWKCDGKTETRTATKNNAPCEEPSTPPTTSRACTPDANCMVTTSPWSTCTKNGKQTRTVTDTAPATCVPVLERECTPPCMYLYGAWSECDVTGKQTRRAEPVDKPCESVTAPVTSRSCTPMCTYNYSDWSACDKMKGMKTRTATKMVEPCEVDPSAPAMTRGTCIPECFYETSEWSACDPASNMVTRTVKVGREPCDEVSSPPPAKMECPPTPTPTTMNGPACVYESDAWTECFPNSTRTRVVRTVQEPCDATAAPRPAWMEDCKFEPCEFLMTDWSECKDGMQERIVRGFPPDCTETTPRPNATQKCANGSCTWKTGMWGACEYGLRHRTVQGEPAGCDEATSSSPKPDDEETCAPDDPPCDYLISNWEPCNVSGGTAEKRLVYPSFEPCIQRGPKPETARNCDGTTMTPTSTPVVEGNCTWDVGAWGKCEAGKKMRKVEKGDTSCTGVWPPKPEAELACEVVCEYNMTAWSACESDFKQRRNITKTNRPCQEPKNASSIPPTEQECFLEECRYVEGQWSECANGVRSRNVTQANPPCAEDVRPVAEEQCGPPLCEYKVGEWSKCENNKKMRSVAVLNSPCEEARRPMNASDCFSAPCEWTTSDWGPCKGNTVMRTVTKKTDDCREVDGAPATQKACDAQSCEFEYNPWQACVDGEQKRVVSMKNFPCAVVDVPKTRRDCVPTCEWKYAAWSACKGGQQTRKAVPAVEPCDEVTAALTQRSCTSPEETAGCDYGEWSECVGGWEKRTGKPSVGSTKESCEEQKRQCVLPTCEYEYGTWSDCKSGKQTRSATAKVPTKKPSTRLRAAVVVQVATTSKVVSTSAVLGAGSTMTAIRAGTAMSKTMTMVPKMATPMPMVSKTMMKMPTATKVPMAASKTMTMVPKMMTKTMAAMPSKTMMRMSATRVPVMSKTMMRASSATMVPKMGTKTMVPMMSKTMVPMMSKTMMPMMSKTMMPMMSKTMVPMRTPMPPATGVPAMVTMTPMELPIEDLCVKGDAPITEQNCGEALPPCQYTFSAWSECKDNIKTRTAKLVDPLDTAAGKAEAGVTCTKREEPSTRERCDPKNDVADPATNTTTDGCYEYSAWSNCSSKGEKTRTMTSKLASAAPSCGNPVLTEKCTPSCIFDYGPWGVCEDGKEKRSVSMKGFPCTQTAQPVVERECQVPECKWQFGVWGECEAEGKKKRSVTMLNFPCTVASAPKTEMECELPACQYNVGKWGACSAERKQTREVAEKNSPCKAGKMPAKERECEIPPCSYKFGPYGECKDGKQMRTVKKVVEPCTATYTPKSERECGDPPCEYKVGDWTMCFGQKQRRDVGKVKEPCRPVNEPPAEQPCVSAPQCEYDYGTWQDCRDGKQSRLVSFKSFPCDATGAPEATRDCLPPCEYDYGEWSLCADGKQTRTATKRVRECSEGAKPYVEKKCTTKPPEECEYSPWSLCLSGKQKRILLKIAETKPGAKPIDCPSIVERGCEQPVCTYKYGDWGLCRNGRKQRSYTIIPPTSTASEHATTADRVAMSLAMTDIVQVTFCRQDPLPELETACEDALPPCEYEYGRWTTCEDPGIQARTFRKKSEADCKPWTPKTTQPCLMPEIKKCDYVYSAYGKCVNGKQTRTVVSAPQDKTCPAPEALTKTCTPTCEYDYGEWTACSQAGKQTRTSKMKFSPCKADTPAVTEKTCTPPKLHCTFSYTQWGPCSMSGVQARSVVKSPEAGCPAGTPTSAEVVQKCTPPNKPGCPANAPADTEWAKWGACAGKMQSRSGKLPSWYEQKDDCPPYVESGPCRSPIEAVDMEHHGMKSTVSNQAKGSLFATVPDEQKKELSVVKVGDTAVAKGFTGEKSVAGSYGTLKIKADGSWTYDPDTSDPTVAAFGPMEGVLTDAFGVEVQHVNGATRKVSIVVALAHFMAPTRRR